MKYPWTAVAVIAGLLTVGACDARPPRVVVGIGMARNIHPAVVLAVKEINAAGGIDGVPLELDGLDDPGIGDRFDPVTTLALANRFVHNEGLVAVIGHSDSASTLSAASVYNANAVPQIVTIATNPAITGIGPWTYRMCLSDAAQGPALADYAVRQWGKRRIAIFLVNDDYGIGLSERFEERARSLGAEIVATVLHRNTLQPDDAATIRVALERMTRETRPDLLVLFQRVAAARQTMQAIREAGLQVDLLGGDNLAQQSLADAPELLSGFRVSQFFAADSGDARAGAFARAYQAAEGRSPDYSQAFAYDAVYLLRDAIAQGGYRRAGVKAYLDGLVRRQTAIQGVGGTFTFGADHDARRPLYVAEVRDKSFHVISSVPIR